MNLYGVLCSFPFNLIRNMTTFRKKNCLTFDPTPGFEGVCNDRICAYMVLCVPFPLNLICNMTTFRKKNVLTFDPTPGVEGVLRQNEYVLACCCIRDSI